MNEKKSISERFYFLTILPLLILIYSIKIFGAEPIAKGKWKGNGAPVVAPIKV